jgi:hypothetical protein
MGFTYGVEFLHKKMPRRTREVIIFFWYSKAAQRKMKTPQGSQMYSTGACQMITFLEFTGTIHTNTDLLPRRLWGPKEQF